MLVVKVKSIFFFIFFLPSPPKNNFYLVKVKQFYPITFLFVFRHAKIRGTIMNTHRAAR